MLIYILQVLLWVCFFKRNRKFLRVESLPNTREALGSVKVIF